MSKSRRGRGGKHTLRQQDYSMCKVFDRHGNLVSRHQRNHHLFPGETLTEANEATDMMFAHIEAMKLKE